MSAHGQGRFDQCFGLQWARVETNSPARFRMGRLQNLFDRPSQKGRSGAAGYGAKVGPNVPHCPGSVDHVVQHVSRQVFGWCPSAELVVLMGYPQWLAHLAQPCLTRHLRRPHMARAHLCFGSRLGIGGGGRQYRFRQWYTIPEYYHGLPWLAVRFLHVRLLRGTCGGVRIELRLSKPDRARRQHHFNPPRLGPGLSASCSQQREKGAERRATQARLNFS